MGGAFPAICALALVRGFGLSFVFHSRFMNVRNGWLEAGHSGRV